jgi:uncharacterized protein with PQ loop repeat
MEDDPLLDLYFPSGSKIKEVPSYVIILTVIGIVCIAIAFIVSIVLTLAYDHPKSDGQLFESSKTRDNLIITLITFGSIGFFFSCFVFYGHYLRNRYDPKNIIKGPMNIVTFPHIDKDIKVNDFRDVDVKPRYFYSNKNKLRNDFL